MIRVITYPASLLKEFKTDAEIIAYLTNPHLFTQPRQLKPSSATLKRSGNQVIVRQVFK